MKAFAFAPQNRLNEKAGFNQVFAKPVYAKKTPFFSVFACRATQSHARLGIVVARKNVRLAVARNKLKRMIRESFRQQQSHLKGLDIVVVVKKDFVAEPCNAIDTPGMIPGMFKAVGDRCAPCSSKQ